MAGLLGIVLSTIDSYLHAMGLTAVHDVWKPLAGQRFNAPKEVLYTRYATVLLSLGAIFASLYTTDFLGLLTLSLEFSGPLLMFPLMAGMMGLKPDQYAFYTALGVTLLALLIMRQWIFVDQEHFVALFSTLANGVVFFGVHIYRNQGLAIVSSSEAKPITWRPQRASISSYLPTPQRILKYSQNSVARYGVAYTAFGLFCCFNFIFPYFMWSSSLVQAPNLMLYIRLIGSILCGLLVVKDKWPSSLLPYLPTFWHFTLLFCLPFTSTVMFLLTQGSVEWLINVAITIMFLIVLVDWLTFFMLTVLGVGLGFLFYRLSIGPIDLQLDFTTGYLLVYTIIFSTSICLLFARRRQQFFERRLQDIATHFSDAMRGLEASVSKGTVMRLAQHIDKQVRAFIENNPYIKADPKPQQQAQRQQPNAEPSINFFDFFRYFKSTAYEFVRQGQHMRALLVEALRVHFIAPKIERLSMKDCIKPVVDGFFGVHKHVSVSVDLEKDFKAYVSVPHFRYTLLQILRFCTQSEFMEENKMRIWLGGEEGKVYVRLIGSAISTSLLEEIFQLFPSAASHFIADIELGVAEVLFLATEGKLRYRSDVEDGFEYTEFELDMLQLEED